MWRRSVDQVGDLGSEELLNLGQRNGGVLNDVVQQSGYDRGGVKLELRDDQGDVERMDDVGFARHPLLAVMHPVGVIVGAPDQAFVHVGIVGPDAANQFLELAVRFCGFG